jgi:hypothetical protein
MGVQIEERVFESQRQTKDSETERRFRGEDKVDFSN